MFILHVKHYFFQEILKVHSLQKKMQSLLPANYKIFEVPVLVFARAFGNAVSAVRPWDRGWCCCCFKCCCFSILEFYFPFLFYLFSLLSHICFLSLISVSPHCLFLFMCIFSRPPPPPRISHIWLQI